VSSILAAGANPTEATAKQLLLWGLYFVIELSSAKPLGAWHNARTLLLAPSTIKSFQIESNDNWLAYSDHKPIILETK
jgi:hypothetical protein